MKKIVIAKIVATKGLKGHLKVKYFGDDPLSFSKYVFSTTKGINLEVHSFNSSSDVIVALFKGYNNINDVEGLIGEKLYINQESLEKLDDDTFYHIDLIGCKVYNSKNEHIGEVLSVDNYGAGDLIEVKFLDNSLEMFPFKKEFFSTIDIKNNKIVMSELETINEESFKDE